MKLGGWIEVEVPKTFMDPCTRQFRAFVREGMKAIFAIEDHGGHDVRHVSVSRPDRYPTWEELKLVRSCFFDDAHYVAQFLPPKAEYVNVHKNCFHLWAKENHDDWM